MGYTTKLMKITSPTIVDTTDGQLEGIVQNGIFSFRGIPYTAPPINHLRWQPPQPVEPWTGVRSAKEFGSVSHQWMDSFPGQRHPVEIIGNSILIVPQSRSEDCLYLNVWTPGLDNAKRPVMVWIHGGGLENGAGSQPNYDGASLARNGDVVVVTINMRLGPFGYLRLADVTNGQIPSTGNEGRMDEIAALQWVQKNIATFGGNPGNVTIFGQSAGAIEVACLIAASPAKGLFHRAILHSTATHSAQTVDHANLITELFLQTAGVEPSDIDAIRNLSPEDLTRTSVQMLAAMAKLDPKLGRMHFNPVIDGTFLAQRPYDAIRAGGADNLSIMVGTTLDDTRVGLGNTPPMAMEYDAALAQVRNFLDDEAPRAMDRYTSFLKQRGAPHDPIDVVMAIETDRVLRQPSILLSEALLERGNPGHHFIVTYESPAYDGRLGSPHAIELAFIFGTHNDPQIQPFGGDGPVAEQFSARMQAAWSSFARTGDPSCDSVGHWPQYGRNRETMMIGQSWSVESAPFEDERQFWATFPGDPGLGLM